MELFEGRVRVTIEEAMRIAESTDIENCDGETASTNFGQWFRIYHAAKLGSGSEKKAIAKMIQIAKRDKTDEDRNRKIVKWRTIFAVSRSGSNEESFAAYEIIKELKRLKKELKSEKTGA